MLDPKRQCLCPFWGIVPFGGLRTGQVFGILLRVTAHTKSISAPRPPRLGERLRQLRVAAGLTQSDLAGDRFSKEYISQIERGKTRPTVETIDWLALRLGVDAGYLASGVSSDERAKAEAMLARADALTQEQRFPEAVEEYRRALSSVLATGSQELQVRALAGEATALAHDGEPRAGRASPPPGRARRSKRRSRGRSSRRRA